MIRFISTLYFSVIASISLAQIGLVYRVSVRPDQKLQVEMSWHSEGSSETILHYGLATKSTQQQIDFKAISERTACMTLPGQVRVMHEKGTKVACSYIIDNQAALHTSKPNVMPDYFHVLGYDLFAFPDGYKQQTVRIEWHNLPRGWVIFNSFGQDQQVQQVSVATGDWRESVWAAGKAQIKETSTKNNRFRSYFLGGTSQYAELLDSLVLHCLLDERRYWEETEQFSGLISVFLPNEVKASSAAELTGMGVKNAFSVFLNLQKPLPLARLRHMLYHETMHYWIGQRITMLPTVTMPDERWFMEGFTEYFSYLVEVKNGHLTQRDLCTLVNQQFIQPLYTNSLPKQIEHAGHTHTYHLGGADMRPYLSGFIYASYLDARLHCAPTRPTTLRELMIELMERGHGHDGSRTDDMLLNMLVSRLGGDIVPIHQRVTGKDEIIPAELFIDCHPLWQLVRDSNGLPELKER